MSELTASEVRELLDYDPATGVFRWRVTRRGCGRAGSIAGSRTDHAVLIRIGGRNHGAHRLAWLYVHGRWPLALIDHRNRDPFDNRLCNLREANHRENAGNKKVQRTSHSGVKGSWFSPRHRAWRVVIHDHGKRRHLGYFKTAEEAAAAYARAAGEIFGEFARAA